MYDHLKLIKADIDLGRKGRRDTRQVRDVNAHTHGKKLNSNYTSIKETFNKDKKFGENFIFRINRDSDKDIQYKKFGLKLLAQPAKTVSIVEVVNEELLLSNLSDFTAMKIAKTRIVNYSDFANIEEFVFQTPTEKKGLLLSQKEIFDNNDYILDIQLYTGEDSLKDLYKKVTNFKIYLKRFKATILDDLILPDLVIVKIQLKGKFIDTLLEFKNVYFADLPQKSIYEFKGNHNLDVPNFPNVLKPLPTDPYIGVIDSGILPTHPLLSGSIIDSQSYGGIESAFDQNGHGTMVAGIIQYGDVYSAINLNSNIKLEYNLLNGRVTDKFNAFPEEKIVASVVKNAIEDFYDNYNCEIFNLSLGDSRTPFVQNTKMDSWSFVLDQLIHKYNIAIVVSSGNYQPALNNEEILKDYMKLLLTDPDAALIPPSLSISSLTVGSIAKDDVPYGDTNRLNHVAIAKKGYISPFSRVGMGYGNSIKPETVANGGNLSLNKLTKRINYEDRNLGIFSTSIFDPIRGSWFETRPGTSFSAPYITHLLGRIKKEIPNAKGNLLRAMLMNTCYSKTLTNDLLHSIKQENEKPGEVSKKGKMLQGFGEVREQYLTKSTDNFVTMYFEGKMDLNKANVFEIPIPDDIYLKKGKCYINITLAYNPPCRDSRIDYKGVHISYELYRGLTIDEIMTYTCKPVNGEFEMDSLPKEKKKCKCKLSPSAQEAAKGTVIRTTHEIAKSKRSQVEYKDIYYLVVKCQEKWFKGNDVQDYAIVVSIEHEDEKAELYIPIQQRTQARTRNQLRNRG